MSKIIKMIRGSDWWEYKFPPMLAIAYLIVLKSDYSLLQLWYLFVIILFALINGAAFVSLLNDATDVREDAIAGKRNSMAAMSFPQRIGIVLLPIVIALVLTIFIFQPDTITIIFYWVAFAWFALYSIPPIRLKKRGVAGIIADASGSQVFPLLFIVTFLLHRTHQEVAALPLWLIGSWSLCFGLRGILWHQFSDLQNDKKSGLIMVVARLTTAQTKQIGNTIIFVETACLIGISLYFQLYSVFVGLLIYGIYLFLMKRKWNVTPIIIRPPETPYRIFMFEFYQLFLPYCILAELVIKDKLNIVFLILNIAFFPVNILRVFNEIKRLLFEK